MRAVRSDSLVPTRKKREHAGDKRRIREGSVDHLLLCLPFVFVLWPCNLLSSPTPIIITIIMVTLCLPACVVVLFMLLGVYSPTIVSCQQTRYNTIAGLDGATTPGPNFYSAFPGSNSRPNPWYLSNEGYDVAITARTAGGSLVTNGNYICTMGHFYATWERTYVVTFTFGQPVTGFGAKFFCTDDYCNLNVPCASVTVVVNGVSYVLDNPTRDTFLGITSDTTITSVSAYTSGDQILAVDDLIVGRKTVIPTSTTSALNSITTTAALDAATTSALDSATTSALDSATTSTMDSFITSLVGTSSYARGTSTALNSATTSALYSATTSALDSVTSTTALDSATTSALNSATTSALDAIITSTTNAAATTTALDFATTSALDSVTTSAIDAVITSTSFNQATTTAAIDAIATSTAFIVASTSALDSATTSAVDAVTTSTANTVTTTTALNSATTSTVNSATTSAVNALTTSTAAIIASTTAAIYSITTSTAANLAATTDAVAATTANHAATTAAVNFATSTASRSASTTNSRTTSTQNIASTTANRAATMATMTSSSTRMPFTTFTPFARGVGTGSDDGGIFGAASTTHSVSHLIIIACTIILIIY
eukprot:TRINITY_DN9750_c0_g1_i1.p1 TRINITY_DN9750_c0_g1~~TRINITY_DN9750_c0_g1_i1.p1  ORF type:complete len:604 (+),score=90.75 TRINITY_DN9750_c0_g1_i1:123-1934(+)